MIHASIRKRTLRLGCNLIASLTDGRLAFGETRLLGL